MILKIAQFCLCFIPALLLATGVAGDAENMGYGVAVVISFAAGWLSK